MYINQMVTQRGNILSSLSWNVHRISKTVQTSRDILLDYAKGREAQPVRHEPRQSNKAEHVCRSGIKVKMSTEQNRPSDSF